MTQRTARALWVVLLLLALSLMKEDIAMAQDATSFEVEVTDRVQHFRTEGGTLRVQFRVQAAEYTVERTSAQFAEILAQLAASWRDEKPVKVRLLGTRITGATVP